MVDITKEKCLEKICTLPVDFEVSNKTSVDLLLKSKYKEFSKDVSQKEIKNYLLLHRNLIDDWKIWSESKRTLGYYLLINSDKYFIGSIDQNGNKNFSKSFITAEDACAEFILKEVSSILDIKIDLL
jgi:hypothetical protein